MSDPVDAGPANERPGSSESTDARPSAKAASQDLPDHPVLRELFDAFERGDYRFVRERAPRLAEETSESAPDVARAARELRSRLDPDPLAIKLILASVALLVFLTAWAYHTH